MHTKQTAHVVIPVKHKTKQTFAAFMFCVFVYMVVDAMIKRSGVCEATAPPAGFQVTSCSKFSQLVLGKTSSPTRDFFFTLIIGPSPAARSQLGPAELPVSSHSGDVPALDTCTNGPVKLPQTSYNGTAPQDSVKTPFKS